MKVTLTQDTRVRFSAGTVLEVPAEEAERLIAFSLAEAVKEEKQPKPVAKKTTAKKAGK